MTDEQVWTLMHSTADVIYQDGRQILMVVDSFNKKDGSNEISIVGIDRKGNGVTSMLVDLIDNTFSPRGIKFETVMHFLNMEAERRGLIEEGRLKI